MSAASLPFLRLGHPLSILRPTLHNGPGWRIAIWVQGCSLNCTKDCLNPHLLPAEGGFEFTVDTIAQAIIASGREGSQPFEGLTVLGGEPSDQIHSVTALFSAIQTAGLSTMLYTGHTLEALRRRFGADAQALLEVTDLLKDGPYVETGYRPDLAWRGSINQRLHCLSSRYTPESLNQAFATQGKGFSIVVTPRGDISLSGLQNRAAAAAMEKAFLSPGSTEKI